MTRIAFEIYKDGQEIPVVYSEEVLEEFGRIKVNLVDQEVTRIWAEAEEGDVGPEGADPRLGVIAPIIGAALENDDRDIIAQCVLWLGIRHPEIVGLHIDEERFEYLSNGLDGERKYLH